MQDAFLAPWDHLKVHIGGFLGKFLRLGIKIHVFSIFGKILFWQ